MKWAFVCAMFVAAAVAQTTVFEEGSVKVISIRPGAMVSGPPSGGPGTLQPGQITWTNVTLKRVLMRAYNVKTYQVIGPDWLGSALYKFTLNVPPYTTKEQIPAMWQRLLARRFGVALHHESQELPVSEMLLDEGGSKLKESTLEPKEYPPGPSKLDENHQLAEPGFVTRRKMSSNGGVMHASSKGFTLVQLTLMLGDQLGHPVVDKTGLTGRYDFELEFATDLKGKASPGPPSVGAAIHAVDIRTALQQQLGLKLVDSKANIDVLVIDNAQRTPNAN